MNSQLAGTADHPSKSISDLVRTDRTIIDLTVGEPGYGPPAVFLDTLKELLSVRSVDPSARYNRYTSSRGADELRREISAYYARLYDLHFDPDSEILVTNGAAGALWTCVFSLTNYGDEVIISDPTYSIYDRLIQALGRRPVRISGQSDHGWVITPAQLADTVTKRTRLVIINSPQNPTGEVYAPETLRQLAVTAANLGLYFVHDEVFDCMIFEGQHVPAVAYRDIAPKMCAVNSFSKRFGMTGWRIGWIVAAPDVINIVTRAHTLSTLACQTAAQIAAAAALNDLTAVAEMRQNVGEMDSRSKYLHNAMSRIPGVKVATSPPKAGFYLYVEVSALARRLSFGASVNTAGDAVAKYLLERGKVAVVPGTAFGANGANYVRLSSAASMVDLVEAVGRISAAVGAL